MKLGRETMAPRRRHRLAWSLGALLVGAGSGVSLVAATVVEPALEPALCSSETLQATVAREAFDAWLGSGAAFHDQDTIRHVFWTRRGRVVVKLVRDGCPVTMIVKII